MYFIDVYYTYLKIKSGDIKLLPCDSCGNKYLFDVTEAEQKGLKPYCICDECNKKSLNPSL